MEERWAEGELGQPKQRNAEPHLCPMPEDESLQHVAPALPHRETDEVGGSGAGT
jgi:hypothetical protein